MGALDAGTLTILAKPLHATKRLTVCIWPLVAVGTAKINVTPDYTEPVLSFPIDTLTGDFTTPFAVVRSQLVRITDPATGAIKWEGPLREAVDGDSILYLAGQREGDSGLAQEFAQSIANNDNVTAYSAYVPSSFMSRLTLVDDTPVLYKREDYEFDTAYPQTQYPEPHARMGRNRIIRIANGGTASMDFTDTSYDFKGDPLDTEWLPPTGMSITVGTAADTTVTVEADAGNYMMRLRSERTGSVPEATDRSNAWRRVFVVDSATGDNPAFSDLFGIAIDADDQDVMGRTIEMTVTRTAGDGDLLDYLYYGAFVLMQEEPAFSDDEWATADTLTHDDGFIDQFAGYVRSYESIGVDKYGVESWKVRVQSPLLFSEDMRIPSQSIIANDPPENWQEASSDLMDIGFWLYTVLFYHAPVMANLHDIYLEGLRVFQLPAVMYGKGTVAGALRELASRRAGALIGCTSDGAFYGLRNPVYEDTTYRTAVAVVKTWADDDIEDGLEYPRDPHMKAGRTTGTAAITDTVEMPTLIEAEAGYLAPTAGTADAELPAFIALDSDDAREAVMHHHAYENRPTEKLDIDLVGNQDVFEPATAEWHKVAIDTYTPLNTDVFGSTRRWLPKTVRRRWTFTPKGVDKRISVGLEPETSGNGILAPLVPAPNIGTAYVAPVILSDHCFQFDFAGGALGWIAANAYTSFSTSYFQSVNDLLAVTFSWSGAITITGITFSYQSGWTNGPAGTLTVRNQSATVIASKAGISAATAFTGMSAANVTGVTCSWNFFPNVWLTAYRLTKITFNFSAASNPFGTDNC